jgi:hypothetical protein
LEPARFTFQEGDFVFSDVEYLKGQAARARVFFLARVSLHGRTARGDTRVPLNER